jgi:hypothetical protein
MFINLILASVVCCLVFFSSLVTAGCADGYRGGRWAIGILYGKSPLGPFSPCLKHGTCAKNPVVTCHDIIDVNASYVADPFLYIGAPGQPWYLLYEVYNYDRKRGEIGCSVSHDKVRRFDSYLT